MDIKVRPSDFPPGMIGLPCAEQLRWSDYVPSIIGLIMPPGTKFKKQPGLGPASPLNEIGVAFNSNPNLKWLFLTNDDNLYQPDTLIRLLYDSYEHDYEVVGGLYLSKIQPFEPIAFTEVLPDEDGHVLYKRLYLDDQKGIIQIAATGDGCLLVRREVMEMLEYPWWEYGDIPGTCDHDMVFSRKIREAGFLLHLDLDVKVDHVGSFVTRPFVDQDGKWQTLLVQGENRSILMPAATVQEAFNRLKENK